MCFLWVGEGRAPGGKREWSVMLCSVGFQGVVCSVLLHVSCWRSSQDRWIFRYVVFLVCVCVGGGGGVICQRGDGLLGGERKEGDRGPQVVCVLFWGVGKREWSVSQWVIRALFVLCCFYALLQ